MERLADWLWQGRSALWSGKVARVESCIATSTVKETAVVPPGGA